jgi:hypothetical protein
MTTSMEKTASTPIIADTSGLVSLVVTTDHNHTAATPAAKRLRSARRPLLVPTDVFVETMNALGKKSGHTVALAFARQVTHAPEILTVIRVGLMSSLDAHRSSSGQGSVVTLRLTAPVRIPGFARRSSVPSDMPPGTVVIHVPLYPGAVPSTRRYTLPPFSGPESAYTKGAWAEYVVPADPATADTWYRQAFARRGYGVSGQSTIAGRRTESTATTFTSASNRNLSVQLGYEAIDAKHTLVL